MNIFVAAGTGSGRTEISAFDAALYSAGVHNMNLVPLSSVIPPHSTVEIKKVDALPDTDWGKRLYCVLSRSICTVIGGKTWSGLGWVQASDGRGLFVEHHAETEEAVHKMIEYSLNDMIAYRNEEFGPIQKLVTGIECVNQPVCSLIVATYNYYDWTGTEL